MHRLSLTEYDPSHYKKANDDYDVVAIQNYGSSGTLFIQSLLDGHPQILSLPARYMRQFYTFWFTLQEELNDHKALTRKFMEFHYYWFDESLSVKSDGLHQLGANRDQSVAVPPFEFAATLLRYLANLPMLTSRNFFIAIYLAYNEVLGRDLSRTKLIVFPLLSLPIRFENGQGLIQDFPDLKVLHMIREPLKTLGSSIKTIVSDGIEGGATKHALAQITCDHMLQWSPTDFKAYGSEPHPQTKEGHSKGLRLEDLHKDPEKTLKRLCLWLNIEWDDRLLKSTFDGKQWWNRPTSKNLSGFNNIVTNQKYHIYFNRLDVFRVKALTHQLYQEWGYSNASFESNLVSRILLFPLLLWPLKSEWSTLPQHKRQIDYRLSQSGKKRMNKHIKAFFILATIGKDFIATRYWAYCGWLNSFRRLNPVSLIDE